MKSIRTLSIIAVLIALFAVSSVAFAGPEVVTFTIPVNSFNFVPCAAGGAGEPVMMTGTIAVTMRTNFTPSGNIHMQEVYDVQSVTAVGLYTGATYIGSGKTQSNYLLNGSGGHSQLLNIFNLAGQDGAPSLRVRATAITTYTETGDVTHYIENLHIQCQ